MPVHLAGAPADVDALTEYGVPIVEDAAQAHGATWRDRPVGTLGDAACFSFQSSKAMTAGEGGLIVTDDEAVYRKVWALHNVGRSMEGAQIRPGLDTSRVAASRENRCGHRPLTGKCARGRAHTSIW